MYDRRSQHAGEGGQGPPEETRNGLDSQSVVVVVSCSPQKLFFKPQLFTNLQNYNLHLNYEIILVINVKELNQAFDAKYQDHSLFSLFL